MANRLQHARTNLDKISDIPFVNGLINASSKQVLSRQVRTHDPVLMSKTKQKHVIV